MNDRAVNLQSVIREQRNKRRAYEASPNLCLFCSKPILPKSGQKLAEVSIKKYCNRSCSASANNQKHPKRQQAGLDAWLCTVCGESFERTRRANGRRSKALRCVPCQGRRLARPERSLPMKTKAQLFGLRRNWQSARSSIQTHARATYLASGRDLKCEICGYSNHVQVAHRKSVSSFDDEATIAEINPIENLCPLCPNHHWEYDHGLLTLG